MDNNRHPQEGIFSNFPPLNPSPKHRCQGSNTNLGDQGHKQFAPLKAKENVNNKDNIWNTEVKDINRRYI